jgi:hypothetical protein
LKRVAQALEKTNAPSNRTLTPLISFLREDTGSQAVSRV